MLLERGICLINFLFLLLVAFFRCVGAHDPTGAAYACAQTQDNLKLDSAQSNAYTNYLPKRCQKIAKILRSKGLERAIKYINEDPDVDSSLFIMTEHEPFEFLAYSRRPELEHAGVQALQKLLKLGDADIIIKKIVSTARKGVGFTTSYWQMLDELVPHHVTYTRIVCVDKTNFIVGATLNTKHQAIYFTLPYRVQSLVQRIKKDGLPTVMALVNNDLDTEDYFFIISSELPYRWVAHGANSDLILKDAHTGMLPLSAFCPPGLCQGEQLMHELANIALRGGGWDAYVWRSRAEEPFYLKLAYVQPFFYKKHRYYIAGSYTPVMGINDIKDKLLGEFRRLDQLIKDVGIQNASIQLSKEQHPEHFYPFIRQAQPPYRSILGATTLLEGFDATTTKKLLRGRNDSFNALKTIQDNAWFAKAFGGFYTYAWRNAPEQALRMHVVYMRYVEQQDNTYYMGAAYVLE